MTEQREPRWYVVQTHAHCEAKAAHHLRRQGFEVYLPRYLKRRRHARKIDNVAAPLFPRYLFVAIDMGLQRWRSIHSTIGVTHLVCYGDRPASIPVDVIEGMKRREDEAGYVKLERRALFSRGDKVKVIMGAFSDALGLFEGISDQDRVSILLELLGRKVRVLLDADFVTAA
jgi:transcriptional antiterminator RfaH